MHCSRLTCVVGNVIPRCSRKKRTGEIREKNADASVTEQRSRQQRRQVVHAVKHRSTLCTNTDVSGQSAKKCRETLQYFAHKHRCVCTVRREVSTERGTSKEAQLCSSGSAVCELDVRAHNLFCPETRKRKDLQLALHALACSSHCTLSVQQACCTLRDPSTPGRDTRSGQGALARRHTDAPLCAALLKTTVMCEA